MEERITLSENSFDTTAIDNITYTATNGNVTVDSSTKVVEVTGNVNISENVFQAVTGYTFNINNAATINGIDFSATSYPAQITYGENHWIVTLDENCTVGNGSQSLGGLDITTTQPITFKLHAVNGGEDTANVGGIRYASKSDGNISVSSDGKVSLSGSVSLSKDLNGKTFTTSGTDTISFSVADNKSVTIDGTKYEVTDAAVISVADKKVTCADGTFSIKPTQNNSVTINGITYTAQASDTSIKLDDGNITLNGKFDVSLDACKSVKINRFNLSADENVSFTFDSADKNFVSSSGTLKIATSYGKSFKVDGVAVTDNGELGTISLTSDGTTLGGNYTVGDGSTSLSNKTFTVGRNEIFFNAKSGDSNLTINNATFSATGKLELTTYFADNDVIKVDGSGVNIDGTGNFILVSTDTATINGIDFKSDTAYSNIKANSDSEVTLNNVFTVGDGTQNLGGLTINSQSVIKGATFNLGTNDSITISGIEYSGSGEIKVAEDNENAVTLSGNVVVNLDKDETITINGTEYKATDDSAKITFDGSNISLDKISIEANSGETTYTFNENSNSITVSGVKFSASNSDATVTVDTPAEDSEDKTKISINGTVTVELNEERNITDYQFSLTQDSTAQIDGIDFKKTSSTSTDADIVFTSESEVTLNSAFTIGDGSQALNGLIFTLETSETSTFNLGGINDSVTIINYSDTASSPDGVEVTGNNPEGITYTGSGSVSVAENNITLNGGITVTSTVDVSSYSFILTAGNSYTFGKTTINPTRQVTISDIGDTLSSDTILSSVNIDGNTFSLTAGAGYTLNLDSDNKVSSITTSGTGTFTIGTDTFITTGTVTFTLENNSVEKITTTESNVTVSVNDADAVPLSSGATLTSYPNGSWGTTPPYDSYIIRGGNVYGVFSGNPATEETITDSTTYSDYFTINNSTANIIGDKSVEIEGAYTAIAGGKTYEITSDGSGTFDNSGITSLALDSGTIYRTIDSGNFTYNNGTYTIDTSPVKFTVTSPPLNDDTSLTSGGGYSTVTTGTTFTLDGDTNTYTAQSGSKYIAKGNESGGYTAFSGTATYTLNGGNFTAETDKTYTISGNATYQLTTADDTDSISTELKTATGTRAFTTGDSENKSYLGDTYNVTGGTYQLSVSNGTEGTKSLTAGSATYTTSNATFHYNNKAYTATQATNLGIQFNGTDTTLTSASGAGTREFESGDNVSTAYQGDTYTAISGATIKIDINGTTPATDSTESFVSGSATYAVGSNGKFHYGENQKEYTAVSNTTITLTVGDNTTKSFSANSAGTRSDDSSQFTYGVNNKVYDSTNSNITYILSGSGETLDEKVFKASGTRTDVSGDTYTVGNHTYNLTAGTYQINVNNSTGNDTLISGEGSGTITQGTTFTHNSKTYTAFDGDVTLNLSVSSSGNTKTETFDSGKGTRSDSVNTFTHNDKTYNKTSSNITYLAEDGGTESVYSASGTRAFTSNDNETYTFNEDEYTATGGTYSINVTTGTGIETLSSGSATYHLNSGTFHYENQTYTAVSETTLTISLEDDSTKELTNATGTGTRQAVAADSTITFNYDSDTYNTSEGSTIKAVINGTSGATESLWNGTATYTAQANSGTFHYNNKEYNAVSDTTITLEVGNGIGTAKTFGTGSAGTRNDDATTFTATGVTGTYNRTSDNITYMLTGSGQTPNETVYNATGTRTDVTSENHVGDWGNTYTLSSGTRTLTVTDGASSDVLTSASATNNYTNGNTFNYDTTEYTATTYGVTLSLSITNDTPTESFSSGSGKNDDGYIIKTQADIGNVTYSSNNNIVKVDTTNDAITEVDGTITGTFNNNSVTIGDIVYSGTGKLKINADVNNVSAESGTFTATGAFSTARTINSSRTLEIDDDSDVKVTFSTGDITKIENLNNGATIVNAGGATTAIASENGTYTFGNQTFVIANDNVDGLTFTLDSNGIATGITGLDRADNGAYVTVDITDNGNSYSLIIRTPGENSISRDNGAWAVPNLDVESYIVTYDGNFKVQAVADDTVITLTETDYTVDTDTNTLDITNHPSVPIVVENTSNETITIDDISVNNTGDKAAQIDTNGNLHIGTQNPDGTFTESTNIPQFYVSNEGKFSISDDGTITVEAKDTDTPVAISITDTSQASLDIGSSGTFEVNGKSSVEVVGHSGDPVQLIFNDEGGVEGFTIPKNGSGTITINDIDDVIILGLLAESADLAEYSVTNYKLKLAATGATVTLDIINNSTKATFSYADGKITGISNLNNDAMIKFSSMDAISSDLKINSASITKGTDSSGNVLSANVVANERIRFNSTNKVWTCGLAQAKGGTYTVEIDSTGEIVLKSGSTQTKNVNDYKAVFGSDTAIKPDYDDDVLPKYNSGITLTAGKVTELKISPPGSKEYTINSKTITLNGESKITPVSNNDFSTFGIELKNGTSAIYDGMTFSGNDSDTNITIPSSTSSAITLAAKTKVSGTVNGKSLNKNGDLIFENADASTGVNIGGNSLKVVGDGNFTVTSGNVIKGLSGDATVSGDFSNDKTIVIDSAGNFKIGTKDYSILGDNDVTIKTNSSGEVSEISGLGATGSVTGNFANSINVNGKDINVTGDTNIGIVGATGDNAVSKIYGLTNGTTANVVKAGGATLLSTDGVGGEFKFGSQTYSLSAGTADFISSGDTPTISEIRNVGANSTLIVEQGETNFKIGGNTITNSAASTLHMGNNTIAGVENFTGEISGLSEGATVNVKTTDSVKINTADVQISDNDYYVYVKGSTGYSTITSVASGSTITKATKDAVIIPDEAGTFTFNGHTIKTDSKPTFTMGNSNNVSEIGGVSGNIALYQDETGLKVLNDTITIKGADSNDAVTLVAGSGSVNQVKNLKGNVNGLNAGAIANVKKSGSITINTKNLNVSDDSDYTVRAKDGGYDLITGLSNGANVSAVEGNVSLVTDGVGTYTFKGHQFDIAGDSEVTFETNADGTQVSNISGVAYATISVHTLESGLSINGKYITVDGSDSSVKIKINGSGGIEGIEGLKKATNYSLPSGATIEVNTGNNLNINGKDLNITGDSDGKVTVRATDDGYDLVTGLSNSAVVTKGKDATFVTDQTGNFIFNGQTLSTADDAQITLSTDNSESNNKVTMVSGVDVGKSLDFYQNETNFVLGVNTLTFGGSYDENNKLSVTMGAGDTVAAVKNLHGGIKGLSAGASVEVATNSEITINADSKKLQISNADSNKVTVHATADGYDRVVGLKDGASVSVVAADVTLTTGGTGTFGFVQNGAYTTGGDDTISFVTDSNNSVKTIFDLTGTVGGDFSNSVTVNNKTVNVTGDTAISIVGNGGTEGISQITNLTDGAVVNNAGGASTISIDGAGEFTFKTGTANHKFSLSGTAGFLAVQAADYNPSITGIKDIGDVTLEVYQDENSLIVENNTIKLTGATSNSPVKLSMNGDTIQGVENLTGEISGLSKGATVHVKDTDVTINDVALKINEGSNSADVTVRTASSRGYTTIQGIGANSTISEAEYSWLMTDAAGTFTFGGTEGSQHKFGTSGDSTVTFVTEDDSNVTEIKGIDVADAQLAVYQNEDININGKAINIGGLGTYAGSSAVSLKFNAGGNITEVSNLTGYINNLPENVTVQVADNDVTINSVALKINEAGGTDFTVKSQATGYDTITGIDTDATISQAANVSIVANIGNMTTTKHKFNFGADAVANIEIVGDSEVTIATDNNSDATAIGGLNGTLTSTADNLKINGVNIYNTDDNVSVVADSGVEHGISSIIGLSDGKEISVHSGVAVSIKPNAATAETKFTINGTAYDLTGDNDGIIITDRTITGLDADARLTIEATGSFNVNTKNLDLTTDRQIVIGEGTVAARLYNPDDIDFGANTPVKDVVEQVFGTGTTVETVAAASVAETISISNRAVVISSTDNNKTVTLGGSALAIVQDSVSGVHIYSTGTSNTVISSASNGVQVTGSNDSDTRIMPTSGKPVTYNGYNHSQNSGLQITNEDVIAAVHDNLLKFTAGSSNITLPNNATVTMNYVADKVGIVNFYNIQGEMQKVGYTYDGNATIDYSQGGDDILLRGKWKDSGVSSTLLGGSGNDTAFGSAGDYFDLGRGKNHIEIANSTGHATIEVSDISGETTVKGFDNTIDKIGTDGDFVRVKTSETDAYYTNDGLMFVYGNSTLNVQDVATASDNTLYAYANVLIANSDDNATVKASIARENEAIKVAEGTGDDDFTTAYVGHNSGVDISNLDKDDTSPATVSVNLNDSIGEFGGEMVAFRGINSLKGGNGKHTLIGNASDKNTLVAGNGEATIWGKGSSNDLLIGNTDTDKYSLTTFFFTEGDGSDTISNFQFTGDTADKISLGAGVSSVTHSGDDLVIVVSGGDSLTVKDGVGETFSILNDAGEISAVTGSNLNYKGSDAYYSATDENATLAVSTITVSTAINLNDSSKYSENITVLDASTIDSGSNYKLTLSGSQNADNTIIAAQNGSELWGNDRTSNDSLVGGNGADVFWYSQGQGNDTISGYGDSDTIYLYSVNTLNASAYSIESNSGNTTVIKMNTNTLTIIRNANVSTSDIIFKLSDGKLYKGFDNLKSGTVYTPSGSNEGNNTEPTNEPDPNSGDLAYDYWEVAENNELLDGEVTFWNGYDISTNDEDNYLTDEICTGNINFSIAPADTIYSFSDK